MTNRSSAIPANRALALDALRGLAILAMLLSGQLPFNQNALPSWMYHAQEPPPTFEWIGTLPGISWVDLVFPLFLFAMGAAFPLALSRRMENKTPTWKLLAFVLERGFLLGFFALFGQQWEGDVTVVHDDLYAGGRPVLTADQVSAGAASTVLDARAPERYRGEVEPVDPVAGHVPGARNLPSVALLDADGRFRSDAELAGLAEQAGAGASTGVYCGSGVTASVVLAALSAAGIDAALFPGSWSQWSGEGRPAAQGPA